MPRSSRNPCRGSSSSATTRSDGEYDCNLRLPASRDQSRDVARDLIVAWFRPMGADEVAYHQATVVGREDDHPGAALDYYGSRGETPLRWGGTGAARLGLAGEVTPESYEAAFGPGGFRDPRSGAQLVATRRPGFELVVSAHKSVAVLGVIDRADEMHSILDVETTETMAWLDGWFQQRGGRRGRVQQRTATGGLVYATTRHATSRAGDPSPHDHVLVANVIEMLDAAGGFKGLDSAALRDTVEAATMVGRLHAAARAVELGFDIEPDNGPSGNLRHWRIRGVPIEVCEQFSKRADDIADHLAATGQRGYHARNVAARATRTVKHHVGADELLPAWRAELDTIGWPTARLLAHLDAAQKRIRGLPFPMATTEIDQLVTEVLNVDGPLLARHKVFTRTHLIAEIAPRLYGRDPAELDRVVERLVASPTLVPLIGIAGGREQSYTTVEVLTAEATIAAAIESLADRRGLGVDRTRVIAAVGAVESASGHWLTDGQVRVVEHVCSAERGVAVVVGVAGAGKTTALDAAVRALEADGFRVLGTSTSGQAARLLGTEARIESRTFASLLWNLDQGRVVLDEQTVLVVDEAGMADDANLARLLLAADRSRASVVLVGDPRQLDAVGPGGALAAVLDRRPELVVSLDVNVRQRDPAERATLAELRGGSVPDAVAWYAEAGRIYVEPHRIDTLVAMADAWAADVGTSHDIALLAWRRADVADLNRLARDRWDQLGRLHGDDVQVLSGRWYAVGDRIVALAPNPGASIVTSQQLTIVGLDEDRIDAVTDDGRPVRITGEGLDEAHLDHAYALTVHRAQGATYDRAHVLAAGGGRELAYVALSRARDHTAVYVTADDLDQALDDLQADWGVDRRQRWIADTPARRGREETPARAEPPARRAPSIADQRADAYRRQQDLEADYFDLRSGTGRWRDTPEGAAARTLSRARSQVEALQRVAVDPNERRSDRRAATKSLPRLEAAVDAAEQQWLQIGEPVAARLWSAVSDVQRQIDRLVTQAMIERLDRLEGPMVTQAAEISPGLSL